MKPLSGDRLIFLLIAVQALQKGIQKIDFTWPMLCEQAIKSNCLDQTHSCNGHGNMT